MGMRWDGNVAVATVLHVQQGEGGGVWQVLMVMSLIVEQSHPSCPISLSIYLLISLYLYLSLSLSLYLYISPISLSLSLSLSLSFSPSPSLQASVLQNLRTAMRRQIRRHSSRRATSRRRLGRLWSRLFHRGSRLRGQIPLLTPPGSAQVTLGLYSYHTAEGANGGSGGGPPQTPSPCSTAALGLALQAHAEALSHPPSESPPSPLSPHSASSSQEEELSPGSPGSPESRSSAAQEDEIVSPSGLGDLVPPYLSQDSTGGSYNRRASRKLVLDLAANVRGVALRRYSSLGGPVPLVPAACPSDPLTLQFEAQRTSSPSGMSDRSGGSPVSPPVSPPGAPIRGGSGVRRGHRGNEEEERGDGDESLLVC